MDFHEQTDRQAGKKGINQLLLEVNFRNRLCETDQAAWNRQLVRTHCAPGFPCLSLMAFLLSFLHVLMACAWRLLSTNLRTHHQSAQREGEEERRRRDHLQAETGLILFQRSRHSGRGSSHSA